MGKTGDILVKYKWKFKKQSRGQVILLCRSGTMASWGSRAVRGKESWLWWKFHCPCPELGKLGVQTYFRPQLLVNPVAATLLPILKFWLALDEEFSSGRERGMGLVPELRVKTWLLGMGYMDQQNWLRAG